jgi:hypothetical protein
VSTHAHTHRKNIKPGQYSLKHIDYTVIRTSTGHTAEELTLYAVLRHTFSRADTDIPAREEL